MNTKKFKILVIDDEPTIRAVIKRTLSKRGYELLFAENGKHGMELLKDNTPDLIVLDLKMPEMDGITFLKSIDLKQDDPYAVIILTGHANDEEMQKCYNLGVHLFMRKPFGYTEFICQVQRLIQLKQKEKEAAQYCRQLEEIVQNKSDKLNKLSHLLEISRQVMLFTDPDGNITYTNKAYSDLSLPPQILNEEHIGREQYESLWNTVKSGQIWQGELQCNTEVPTDNYHFKSLVFPFKSQTGEVENLFFILENITGRE